MLDKPVRLHMAWDETMKAYRILTENLFVNGYLAGREECESYI
jgi:hypothetical protein